MTFLYSFGLFLYLVLASPFYILRVLRGRYRSSFLERLGWGLTPAATRSADDRGGQKTIWVHACSVGEAEAAQPLIEILRRKRPGSNIIVSTTTETGHARAKKLYPFATIRYLPFDFLFAIRRHLDHGAGHSRSAGPLSEFFIMETELWPNLILELVRRDIPIFISNGRISDKAWPRYKFFANLFKPFVSRITAVAARSEIDAERFRFLGAPCVAVAGNVKFDKEAAPAPSNPPSGRIIIFGSTHPGEDEICAHVYLELKKEFTDLRAIIAPRHIERARRLAASLADAPGHGGVALRTAGWADEDFLILDTHGELAGMYSIAEAVFIGGSLVPVGGHNPLEAAIQCVPVLWGPHVENFRDACDMLIGTGGFLVADKNELILMLRKLLTDKNFRVAAGADAKNVVLAHRGAAERNWLIFGLKP